MRPDWRTMTSPGREVPDIDARRKAPDLLLGQAIEGRVGGVETVHGHKQA